MHASLEELIDDLGDRLGRNVAVDDAALRLLAYSPHNEAPDRARLEALIGRRATTRLREYAASQRISTWREPSRLAANPDVGLDFDRIGFPLRSDRHDLLGFLWLIDDGTLSGADLDVARSTAATVGRLLSERSAAEMDADQELSALVADLVGTDETARRLAVASLGELGKLVDATMFVVIVAAPQELKSAPTGRPGDQLLLRVLRRGVGHRGIDSHVGAVRPGHALMVLGLPTGRTEDARAGILRSIGADPIVSGIGGLATEPSGIPDSYAQALLATEIARRRDERVVAWDDHPLEALIGSLRGFGVDRSGVPRLLTTMLARPSRELAVVERFLDRAGNVAAVAEELHLHRTTVYYHLRRFESSTETSLDDGRARLIAHLGFVLLSLGLIENAGPSAAQGERRHE